MNFDLTSGNISLFTKSRISQQVKIMNNEETSPAIPPAETQTTGKKKRKIEGKEESSIHRLKKPSEAETEAALAAVFEK